MSEKPLMPVYLLAGSDRSKIRLALIRLKARFEGAQTITADAASGEEAVAELNALGLFGGGGGRLVIVEGVERWKAEDAEAVAAYLAAPVEGADLEHGDDPFLVAVRLAAQVGLVRAARALSDEGLNARDIAKRLRRHEFRVRKALGHADNYSRDELDAAVVRLAELDAALKGASRLAGDLELERALVELMRAPEPAARV